MSDLNDQSARQKALDISQSYIVQAPAGSGKTELLTQRYLNLLAHVEQPENIIAVTFTRKAAHEMRQRVIDSLLLGQGDKPEQAHKLQTWHLAKQALQQNNQLNWQLLQNKHRLRIITIDSLSAFLCRQTPLLSGIDPNLSIDDQPQALYQKAIEQLLTRAEHQADLKQAIHACLFQLDNNVAVFQQLLQDMLARRDQWLPHIMPHYMDRETLKHQLESHLESIVAQKVQAVHDSLNPIQRSLLLDLGLKTDLPSDHPITQHCKVDIGLSANAEDYDRWAALSDLLLTQKNEWRSQVTKRQGFPVTKKQDKQDLLELIHQCQASDSCLQAWNELRLAPSPCYATQQWAVLDSLITLLPQLVAYCQWVFQQQHSLDFCEIGLAAERALGGEDSPTDLALYLDYKIQHLLIDEFQDTSTSQHRLITQLIREWQPGDGRSLFLVGDPMQSIYRFRQAEVGLFLQTQQVGIAQLQPISLHLTSNFRSSEDLVAWFNASFIDIFPKTACINSGAINFHASVASQPNASSQAVTLHEIDSEVHEGADCVLSLLQQLKLDNTDEQAAVLVQTRLQAQAIIDKLNEHNIRCQAIDINPLSSYAEVDDLLTLTRTLLHPADRIAWLALLRSPIIGLSLADCLALCQHAKTQPLWPSLLQHKELALSDYGQKRLPTVVQILQLSYQQQGRLPLTELIHDAWVNLGFDQYYGDKQQRQHVEQTLDIIHQQTQPIDVDQLSTTLHRQYSQANSDLEANIQIMTIHKSKGLEFDHVIIPFCERKQARDSSRLLQWQQIHYPGLDSELILAPIKSPEQKSDAIYRYCQQLEQQKLQHEFARVLYVAATRAKSSLHLIREKDNSPKGSFAALLDNKIDHILLFEGDTTNEITANKNESDTSPAGLLRLCNPPTPLIDSPQQRILPDVTSTPQMTLADLGVGQGYQRQIGIIIHQQLHQLAQQRDKTFNHANIRMQCNQHQLPTSEQEINIASITTTLESTLNDSRGQWILANHEDSHCEYEIDTLQNGKKKSFIIDRTFIDDGIRWVIDYKSAKPADGQSNEDFLNQQMNNYREQLDQYAKLFSELDSKPIRCALYFPSCSLWHEWSYDTVII